MIFIDGELFVYGGLDFDFWPEIVASEDIYRLSCANDICKWNVVDPKAILGFKAITDFNSFSVPIVVPNAAFGDCV